MAQDQKNFLSRWSRRKLDAAKPAAPAKPAPVAAAPESLPSPDSLTFESDFKAFMHSKVEEGVKRAALKKLFADPRFNVIDVLDTYIDDYSIDDPIPEAMLAQLEHSKATLSGGQPPPPPEPEAEPGEPQKVAQVAQAPAPAPPTDEAATPTHGDRNQDA